MSEITEIGEPPKKQLFRLQIPFSLRFALIWLLFFSILGLVLQYIQSQVFDLRLFFIDNYIQWLKYFGSLFNGTAITYSSTPVSIYQPLLVGWYYFFLSGGIIALLWGIISWIVNFEVVVKKPEYDSNNNLAQQEQPKKKFMAESEKNVKQTKDEESLERMNEWLTEGARFLTEGNLEEAELIYVNLRQEYNPENDAYGVLQRRIVSFYEEILAERKEQFGKKK